MNNSVFINQMMSEIRDLKKRVYELEKINSYRKNTPVELESGYLPWKHIVKVVSGKVRNFKDLSEDEIIQHYNEITKGE